MSAGVFTTSFYSASYGGGTNVHPIRVQPETLEATVGGTITNEPSASATTSPISALVSRNRGSKGLLARIIYLELGIDETPPEGYSIRSRTKIPILTEDFYNAAIAPGNPIIQYLGAAWTVAGSSAEVAK